MEIKKSTLNKFLHLGLLFSIVGILALVTLSGNKSTQGNSTNGASVTVDGKQIVQVNAKAGYSPRLNEAKANALTVLRVTTKNTFDCSTALTIPKLGINRNLPPTGNTDIEIPPQSAGTVLNVTCSMGMYSFQIKFV